MIAQISEHAILSAALVLLIRLRISWNGATPFGIKQTFAVVVEIAWW
jgi:hypothetical protein